MYTGLKPKSSEVLTDIEKNYESIKLKMTGVELEAYIHQIKKEYFMPVSDSKQLFFQWIKERKQ